MCAERHEGDVGKEINHEEEGTLADYEIEIEEDVPYRLDDDGNAMGVSDGFPKYVPED